MKLTKYFSAKIKPALVGVYDRNDKGTFMYNGMPNYSYWDGSRWGVSCITVKGAHGERNIRSSEQNLPWRGLAEDPSKSA